MCVFSSEKNIPTPPSATTTAKTTPTMSELFDRNGKRAMERLAKQSAAKEEKLVNDQSGLRFDGAFGSVMK